MYMETWGSSDRLLTLDNLYYHLLLPLRDVSAVQVGHSNRSTADLIDILLRG